MVRRGALERCETGANPLETRGKRKPITPENDPRETGLSFLNGGGGGSRTRVRKYSTAVSTCVSSDLISRLKTPKGRIDQALSCLVLASLPPGKKDQPARLYDALIRPGRHGRENGSRLMRLQRNRSCLRLYFPTCLTRPVGTSTRCYSFNYPRRNRDAPM